MHLLIAEDNQDHAELLIETLADLYPPAEITHKYNGEEVITFLEQSHLQGATLPDFILLDIKMPRMNGIEVLATLQQNAALKHLPVAMLSTSTNTTEMQMCLQSGAVSYIAKPLTAEDFEHKVLPHLPPLD